ncbi:MAG TPA: hypothetical protein VIL84_00195 [Devosiaceae bacterium]
MRSIFSLTTATAIGLFMSTSWSLAASNTAVLTQDGATNTATITQTSGSGNMAGDTGQDMEQHGYTNVLTITQSGADNQIGLYASGLDQTSDQPSGDDAPSNTATINQTSDGNSVGLLQQISQGAHASTGNSLMVNQETGTDNTIHRILQTQTDENAANTATLTESGASNWIERVQQESASVGAANEATVTITGSNNGGGSLGVLAYSAGGTPSTIIQSSDLVAGGANNQIDLSITGDDNQFGITQYGANNSVGTLSISGSSNSLGTYQRGDTNLINAGNIGGDTNDVGIYQSGDSNTATLNLNYSSSTNEAAIGQYGDYNTASLNVTGDSNYAGIGQLGDSNYGSVAVTGSTNVVLGVQVNTGGVGGIGNDLTVGITGDGNNALIGGSTAAFTGAAALVANAGPLVSDLILTAPGASSVLSPYSSANLLTPGALVQLGEDNHMDIQVGAISTSNNNLFAAVQAGTGNMLSASVNGDGNQFAILQSGNGNTSSISQTGNGNVIGISQ